MRERRYVKFRVDMLSDTKSKIIDTKPERDLIHYVWMALVLLAGNVNREGDLYLSKNIPYTIETLALEFSRSIEQIQLALNLFIELEMVEVNGGIYSVKNFAKHQNIKVKEKNNIENVEKNLKEEETLEKENFNNNIANAKDLDKENNIDKNIINNTFKNLDSLPREVSLVNETLAGEIHKQDNKSNNLSENKNSNEVEVPGMREVTGMMEANFISLENKKGGEKRKKKKKEHTINSDQDESDDIEICSLYEGEYVLPEGERLLRSWVFD